MLLHFIRLETCFYIKAIKLFIHPDPPLLCCQVLIKHEATGDAHIAKPTQEVEHLRHSHTKSNTGNEASQQGEMPSMEKNEMSFPCITDIKKAIPNNCFHSNLWTSLYFVLKDITFVAAMWGAIVFAESLAGGHYNCILHLAYPVYWFLQGTMFWAIFVLGHDCGHGSFSAYPFFNDVLGNLLHGFILVPYYPWKLSHKNHHKNTGNIDKDEIFYPVRENLRSKDIHPLPGFGLGISWFYYLFRGYPPRPVGHLNPYEEMMKVKFAWCTVSVVTVAAMAFAVGCYGHCFGYYRMLNHYVMPCLIFASWLVVVTFLHHNDVNVPWYGNNLWTNVKGQLSSVDRNYGWAHGLTHNIGTHQIHHLFTKIPHYKLEEATAAFRGTFPNLVNRCDEPILAAFWRMFTIFESQRHISNDAEIHSYSEKWQ